MFVLICTSGKYRGQYVAMPGYEHSYTKNIENAQKFTTKDEAIKNSCIDNEIPRHIEAPV